MIVTSARSVKVDGDENFEDRKYQPLMNDLRPRHRLLFKVNNTSYSNIAGLRQPATANTNVCPKFGLDKCLYLF